jgi:hypothetical protein
MRGWMRSPWAANELKKTLYDKKLIAIVRAGEGEMRYSTKRMICGKRKSVVVIFAEICEND